MSRFKCCVFSLPDAKLPEKCNNIRCGRNTLGSIIIAGAAGRNRIIVRDELINLSDPMEEGETESGEEYVQFFFLRVFSSSFTFLLAMLLFLAAAVVCGRKVPKLSQRGAKPHSVAACGRQLISLFVFIFPGLCSSVDLAGNWLRKAWKMICTI